MEIASADDDAISKVLLHWSGLESLWTQNALGDLFDFGRDVAFKCRNIDVETKAWSNLPGHGGEWYTVSSLDQEKLKEEMKAQVLELLRQHQKLIAENLQKSQAAAQKLAGLAALGLVKRLTVTADGVTFTLEQFGPRTLRSLSVSAQDWLDIQAGQAIQYLNIPYIYEGLIFDVTWRFNCVRVGSVWSMSRGSVWVELEEDDKPFVGTLSDFARSG